MVKKWIFEEFFKKNLVKYMLGIFALVSSSLLQLVMPKLLGYITDSLQDRTKSMQDVYMLAFLMVGVAALLFAMKYCLRYFLMGRARDLECFLRAKLFGHLQTLPPKFYNNKKTGDLMAYAINDLGAIRRAFAFGLVFLIDGVIINLSSLFIMVRTINPLLTFIALAPVSLSLILIIKLRSAIRLKFRTVQEAFAELSDKIQENISGIRVVKAYIQEGAEIKKLEQVSKHRRQVQLNYIKLSATLGPAVQICFGLSFTLVLIIGSRFVTKGIITLGDFVAFNTYLAMLTGPVSNIGKIVEVWQNALASINRLDDIFMTKTDIEDNSSGSEEEKFDGAIEIKNLSFTYPGSNTPALKDISLRLAAGKTLGIIGRTGSGKTTLVNLLLRLYKVDKDKLLIDGIDINDIPLTKLRNNIGYVPQDNFLFSATLENNIEFFKEIYTIDDVEDAAKAASVYENIMGFPEKFETMVGERGITLSGGQKQRVSIARTVIKDPSILILDDSLSAVDMKTEEEILSNIKTLLKNRTGIMIAHRISTIKHADEIIVLDQGKIIESGTHQELLDLKGYYYKLYCAQIAENRLQNEEEMVI